MRASHEGKHGRQADNDLNPNQEQASAPATPDLQSIAGDSVHAIEELEDLQDKFGWDDAQLLELIADVLDVNGQLDEMYNTLIDRGKAMKRRQDESAAQKRTD